MYSSLVRTTLLIVCFCISASTLRAQTGATGERLFTFIKVWGFLKYYHPACGLGRVEADSLFNRGIAAVQLSTTDVEFKKGLSDMLRALGPAEKQTEADTTQLFTRNQDFKWIRELQLIPPDVRKELKKLQATGYTGSTHKYMPANFHETQLPGEDPHAEITYPNQQAQLLTLARY